MLGKYVINLIVAVDEFFNALAGGSPHETISSRVGRNYPNTRVARFINALFFWQRRHCQNSIEPADYEKDALLK